MGGPLVLINEAAAGRDDERSGGAYSASPGHDDLAWAAMALATRLPGGLDVGVTRLGIRLGRSANGVSERHCAVAREMWRHPRWRGISSPAATCG